jgi:hypothetical protein
MSSFVLSVFPRAQCTPRFLGLTASSSSRLRPVRFLFKCLIFRRIRRLAMLSLPGIPNPTASIPLLQTKISILIPAPGRNSTTVGQARVRSRPTPIQIQAQPADSTSYRKTLDYERFPGLGSAGLVWAESMASCDNCMPGIFFCSGPVASPFTGRKTAALSMPSRLPTTAHRKPPSSTTTVTTTSPWRRLNGFPSKYRIP